MLGDEEEREEIERIFRIERVNGRVEEKTQISSQYRRQYLMLDCFCKLRHYSNALFVSLHLR